MSSFYQKPGFWIVAGGLATFTLGSLYFRRSNSTKAAAKQLLPTLSPEKFTPLTLQQVQTVTGNTKLFRFQLPSEEHFVNLPVASCLLVKADIKQENGEIKEVVRPYTPVQNVVEGSQLRGQPMTHLDLVIKVYPNGQMSNHIFNMKPGDSLLFKGPLSKIQYEKNKWKHIGMIAGGTGLTPMLQVIQESLSDSTDKTKVTLLYGNQTPDDILLKQTLDRLQKEHPDRFKPHPNWDGLVGYVDQKMYETAGLPKPTDENSIVFVCGNMPMMNAISGPKAKDKSQGFIDPKSLLGRMGFKEEQVFKF